MSKKIILTSKHYNATKNQFIYEFPMEQNFEDYELALTQFNLFNSFYNISKSIGNNILIIGVPNATGTIYTDLTLTVPDGFYDTNSFNTYLQSVMYENNLYNSPSSSTVIYYLSLNLLATEYKNSMSFYKLSGVTLQNGITYSTIKDVYLNIRFSAAMGELFGFTSTITYGVTTTNLTSLMLTTIKSNLVPQVNPFTSLIITCDLINIVGSTIPDYLYSVSLNSAYGSMIDPKKIESIYMQCSRGYFKTMSLTIFDNYFNKLNILDNNSMFVLTFKKKK